MNPSARSQSSPRRIPPRRLLLGAFSVLCAGALALLWNAHSHRAPEPSQPKPRGDERLAPQSIELPAPEASPPTQAQAAVSSEPGSELSADQLEALRALDVPEASLGPQVEWLRESDVDGGLEVDQSGRFVATADTLRLFQYFFLADGQEPLAVIRGRIAREIVMRLPEPAWEDAVDALERYLSLGPAIELLKKELAEETPGSVEPWDAFERLRAVRRGVLGDDLASGLYAEEEFALAQQLERRAIEADVDLTPEQRAAALRTLEEQKASFLNR